MYETVKFLENHGIKKFNVPKTYQFSVILEYIKLRVCTTLIKVDPINKME